MKILKPYFPCAVFITQVVYVLAAVLSLVSGRVLKLEKSPAWHSMEEDPSLAEKNEEIIYQNEGSGLFELKTEAPLSRKETPNYDATSVFTKEATAIGASPQLTLGRLRRDTSCVVAHGMVLMASGQKVTYVICADDCVASQAIMVGGIAYATQCKRN